MKGHYRIPLSANETPETNPRVIALLKAFDTGAKYTIKVWNEPFKTQGAAEWQTKTFPRYCEIRAHGGTAKRCKPPARRALVPAAPTVEQLTKRLTESQHILDSARTRLGENLKRQWRDDPYLAGYREHIAAKYNERRKHRRVGRAIARILAIKQVHAKSAGRQTMFASDYRILDAACGRKVERESKLSKGRLDRSDGYLGYIVRTYAGSWRALGGQKFPKDLTVYPTAIETFLEVKARTEYLAELVRLARERQRVIPMPTAASMAA